MKIILTGYSSPQDRREAFDRHADGFIIKPVRIDSFVRTPRQHEGRLAVVAVGASAGGPAALERVFSRLPHQMPAALVVSQHMPNGFTKQFSERLAAVSDLQVREAQQDDVVQAGTAFITPGGQNMKIAKDGRIQLKKAEQTPSPSIDIMMKSVADAYSAKCVGVLMSGMLNDGVIGMKAIRDHGGVTIAQDESSSVVFGMNKAAIEAGAVDVVAHVSIIADRIVNAVSGFSAGKNTVE